MAVFKCKMCGGQLEVNNGEKIVTCDYCDTCQTVPSTDNEKIILFHNRANTLRLKNEFDKAIITYENILSEKSDDAESYWGLVLCKYGIEYIDDPNTGKKIPTCHRTQYQSILNDSDYLNALKYSDVQTRNIYEKEAKEIDNLQKNIIELSQKEEPYDIFICYKESDQGKRTKDSVIAQELYDILTDKGYKVFFAKITLESKLGKEYEPIIFAALNTAKVMLVLGTRTDFFTSVWVKNEWSRYISIMEKSKEKKYIIPCFKDMDAYDLPDELVSFQSQDMSKIGFVQDLIRGLDKLLGNQMKNSNNDVIVKQGINIDNLLNRCVLLLNAKEFSKVSVIADEILNIDSTNANAYLYSLFAQLSVSNEEELEKVAINLEENSNYKLAKQFGDNSLKEKLEDINIKVKENIIEDERLQAIKLIDNYDFDAATSLLNKNTEYKDNKELLNKIGKLKEYEIIYQEAKEKMKDKNLVENAITDFTKINPYKDSEEQLEKCYEIIYKEAKEAIRSDVYELALKYLALIPKTFKDTNELFIKTTNLFETENSYNYKLLQEALKTNDLETVFTLGVQLRDYKDAKQIVEKLKNDVINKLLTTNTFGKYPQSRPKGIFLNMALKNIQNFDSKGYAIHDGVEYFKGGPMEHFKFFVVEPIKWQIVKKTDLDDNSYLLELVPEKLLDETRYSLEQAKTVNYKTIYPSDYSKSDLRQWLNRTHTFNKTEPLGFMERAFNKIERSLINLNYIEYNDIILKDYVFTYSKKEIDEVFKTDREKIRESTEFASRIAKSNMYYLRDPWESDMNKIKCINNNGSVTYTYCSFYTKFLPVIRIKISK